MGGDTEEPGDEADPGALAGGGTSALGLVPTAWRGAGGGAFGAWENIVGMTPAITSAAASRAKPTAHFTGLRILRPGSLSRGPIEVLLHDFK